jgi:ribosomal-protein-alanine N-acetyltransferase
MTIIEGKRLTLRDYEPGDFAAFRALVSDPELRALSVLRTPRTEEEARREFDAVLADRTKTDRRRYILGAFLNGAGTYIADAGFDVLKRNPTGGVAEIGYFLDPGFRGKGYATEMARLLISYCFGAIGMHKVVASCDKRNSASEHVMLRCGMRKEGEFAKQRFKDTEWFDELKYAILKDGY